MAFEARIAHFRRDVRVIWQGVELDNAQGCELWAEVNNKFTFALVVAVAVSVENERPLLLRDFCFSLALDKEKVAS